MRINDGLRTYENSGKISLVYLFAVPIIIFLYFLQWKSHVFYGDDLSTYKYYVGLKTFWEKINIAVAGDKFRPVQGVSLQLIIDSFGKNADGYYWFNVLIQSVNTFIFAYLLNLYLKSHFLSILFALLLGLSRFALFNITQLMNGGPLEGIAMTFFLCFLYYTVQYFRSGDEKEVGARNMLFAILFANLSLYTHERYIVLLPFLLLVLIATQTIKKIKQQQPGLIAVLIIGSIVLNVVIKKYIIGIPFFVGTGGAKVDFSVTNAFSFLKDAVANILLINTGPEYLVGASFSSLSLFYKSLIILTLLFVVFMVINFLRKKRINKSQPQQFITSHILDILLLAILFFLLLAPAIVTIRLEHRWLQASFSIFVLVIVMLSGSLKFNTSISRHIVCALVAVAFLLIDHEYLSKKTDLLYMISCENTATVIKKGIDKGTIRKDAKNLFIWEKTRDLNAEIETSWVLGNGYFFDFYDGNKKNITYIDSVYERAHLTADTTFFHFNPNTDQLIMATTDVFDITENFLRDSLKNFGYSSMTAPPSKVQYDSANITVGSNNFSDFMLDGFYKNENGFRWTNGSASIGFVGNYGMRDSVFIELKTFLPPVCKNISPEISLKETGGNVHKANLKKKNGDTFFYSLYLEKPVDISRIVITSDTIDAHPDVRRLSFPFIGLNLKQVQLIHKK